MVKKTLVKLVGVSSKPGKIILTVKPIWEAYESLLEISKSKPFKVKMFIACFPKDWPEVDKLLNNKNHASKPKSN